MQIQSKIIQTGQRVTLFALLFFLSGCSCCLYFNHYYNVKKYSRRGHNMLEARRDSLPNDTLWTSEAETKNWDKVINTGSLILDRWTDDREYKADVLMHMGDAYFYEGKWREAITKYDELERYFPNYENLPLAEYHRIWSMHKLGESALAAFNAKELLTNRPDHPYRDEIQEIYAQTFTSASQSDQAIEILERLLTQPGEPGLLRARVRLQLADLYFAKEDFLKARPHYEHQSTQYLNLDKRYYSLFQGVQCSYFLKEYDLALNGILPLSQTPYDSFALKSKIEEGRIRLHTPEPSQGIQMLDSIGNKHSRSSSASYSYWILGDYFENQDIDLKKALEFYNRSVLNFAQSKYGELSNERAKALKKFLALQKKPKEERSTEEQFRYAELFLYDQNKADSSLAVMEELIQRDSLDSLSHLKALYTKAFLLDEYLEKNNEAQVIYEEIIQNHPNSPFARQAEINLGREQSVQTLVDRAQIEFTAAESSYYALDSLQLVDTLAYDSLLPQTLAQFDTLSKSFEGTPYAAKALFLKAWILEKELKDLPQARELYLKIAEKFPDTPYGEKAFKKTSDYKEDDKVLKREKTILEDMEKNHKKRVDRRIRNEKRQEKMKKPTEEELLWDYNHLYDF